MYYHIDKTNSTIISGPHYVSSDYIKKLTRCGTPEVLNLFDYDLVPEIKPTLTTYQSYGDPVVDDTNVTFPIIDWTVEQIAEYNNQQLINKRNSLSCSPAQGQLALLQANLLDTVEQWISTQPRNVQIEYSSRTEWKRNWTLVIDAAIALGISDTQLDELFELAQTL